MDLQELVAHAQRKEKDPFGVRQVGLTFAALGGELYGWQDAPVRFAASRRLARENTHEVGTGPSVQRVLIVLGAGNRHRCYITAPGAVDKIETEREAVALKLRKPNTATLQRTTETVFNELPCSKERGALDLEDGDDCACRFVPRNRALSELRYDLFFILERERGRHKYALLYTLRPRAIFGLRTAALITALLLGLRFLESFANFGALFKAGLKRMIDTPYDFIGLRTFAKKAVHLVDDVGTDDRYVIVASPRQFMHDAQRIAHSTVQVEVPHKLDALAFDSGDRTFGEELYVWAFQLESVVSTDTIVLDPSRIHVILPYSVGLLAL